MTVSRQSSCNSSFGSSSCNPLSKIHYLGNHPAIHNRQFVIQVIILQLSVFPSVSTQSVSSNIIVQVVILQPFLSPSVPISSVSSNIIVQVVILQRFLSPSLSIQLVPSNIIVQVVILQLFVSPSGFNSSVPSNCIRVPANSKPVPDPQKKVISCSPTGSSNLGVPTGSSALQSCA